MVAAAYTGYPFDLTGYHPVFDDGITCQRELKEENLDTWRPERFPLNSNVLVLDHNHGKHKIENYDDAGIDGLLAVKTMSVQPYSSTDHSRRPRKISHNCASCCCSRTLINMLLGRSILAKEQ